MLSELLRQRDIIKRRIDFLTEEKIRQEFKYNIEFEKQKSRERFDVLSKVAYIKNKFPEVIKQKSDYFTELLVKQGIIMNEKEFDDFKYELNNRKQKIKKLTTILMELLNTQKQMISNNAVFQLSAKNEKLDISVVQKNSKEDIELRTINKQISDIEDFLSDKKLIQHQVEVECFQDNTTNLRVDTIGIENEIKIRIQKLNSELISLKIRKIETESSLLKKRNNTHEKYEEIMSHNIDLISDIINNDTEISKNHSAIEKITSEICDSAFLTGEVSILKLRQSSHNKINTSLNKFYGEQIDLIQTVMSESYSDIMNGSTYEEYALSEKLNYLGLPPLNDKYEGKKGFRNDKNGVFYTLTQTGMFDFEKIISLFDDVDENSYFENTKDEKKSFLIYLASLSQDNKKITEMLRERKNDLNSDYIEKVIELSQMNYENMNNEEIIENLQQQHVFLKEIKNVNPYIFLNIYTQNLGKYALKKINELGMNLTICSNDFEKNMLENTLANFIPNIDKNISDKLDKLNKEIQTEQEKFDNFEKTIKAHQTIEKREPGKNK